MTPSHMSNTFISCSRLKWNTICMFHNYFDASRSGGVTRRQNEAGIRPSWIWNKLELVYIFCLFLFSRRVEKFVLTTKTRYLHRYAVPICQLLWRLTGSILWNMSKWRCCLKKSRKHLLTPTANTEAVFLNHILPGFCRWRSSRFCWLETRVRNPPGTQIRFCDIRFHSAAPFLWRNFK
jgi:hypothetical protein